jgi:hypothetical protein
MNSAGWPPSLPPRLLDRQLEAVARLRTERREGTGDVERDANFDRISSVGAQRTAQGQGKGSIFQLQHGGSLELSGKAGW